MTILIPKHSKPVQNLYTEAPMTETSTDNSNQQAMNTFLLLSFNTEVSLDHIAMHRLHTYPIRTRGSEVISLLETLFSLYLPNIGNKLFPQTVKNEASFSWLPSYPRLLQAPMLTIPDPFRCSSSELSVCFLQGSLQWMSGLFQHWKDLLRSTSAWWAYNSSVRLWNRKLSCSPTLNSWFLTRGWAHVREQGIDGIEPVCPLGELSGGDPESHLTYTQPTVETTASPSLALRRPATCSHCCKTEFIIFSSISILIRFTLQWIFKTFLIKLCINHHFDHH